MPANILRAFFVFFETKLLSGTPKFLKNLTGTISATYIPYLSHTHFLSVEKLRLLRLKVPFVSIYADTSAHDSREYGIFSSLASSFCALGSNATRKSQLYTCSWNSVLVFPYMSVYFVFSKSSNDGGWYWKSFMTLSSCASHSQLTKSISSCESTDNVTPCTISSASSYRLLFFPRSAMSRRLEIYSAVFVDAIYQTAFF